jgi:hypothetical protein
VAQPSVKAITEVVVKRRPFRQRSAVIDLSPVLAPSHCPGTLPGRRELRASDYLAAKAVRAAEAGRPCATVIPAEKNRTFIVIPSRDAAFTVVQQLSLSMPTL